MLGRRKRLLLGGLVFVTVTAGGCGAREGADHTERTVRLRQIAGGDGPLRIEVGLDTADVTTAQRLHLSVTMRVLDGWRVEGGVEEAVSKALPTNWKISEVRSDQSDGGKQGKARVTRSEVVIEPFLEGEAEIGAIEFTAGSEAGGDAAPVAVRSEPMKVRVRSVLAGEADQELAAVKSVVEPAGAPRWVLWSAGVGVVTAIGALAWWIVARRGRDRTPEPPRVAAHTAALERLDALLASGRLDRGEYKAFYIAASRILRRYIEDRFGLHAPQWTTEELIAAARVSLALAGEDVRAIERFTRACDEVKFAAAQATRTQALETARAAREFVERTRSEEAMVIVGEGAGETSDDEGGEADER